jgi:hypothetical protein
MGIFFCVAPATHAQTDRKLTATPKSFQVFYAKFRKAVLARDKNAVASMTSFPLRYGWDAGDEGKYSRKQFLVKFDDMFRGTRKLFSRANPTFYGDRDSFDLTNTADASHYGFTRKRSTYYFDSFMVEP